MQKVAPELLLDRREAALAGDGVAVAVPGAWQRLVGSFDRWTDGQLALLLSALLFVLAAWPMLLVDVPPLQDLPNHLAAITVIQNPDQYPELVYNGLLKTNSALFTWLLLVGRVVGTPLAAKLFCVLVLALGAIAYPRFVLSFGGRRRMVLSTLFAWPMVHNWFVSMGMLDFAFSVPVATLLLVLLNAQRERPTLLRGAGIAVLGVVTWHAHVFPLLAVHMLALLHVLTRRSWSARWEQARRLVVPLLPSTALVLGSLWVHFTEPVGAMSGYVNLGKSLPVWELFYNLWAEWFYGFTWLTILTVVPCIAMGLWALYRFRDDVPFFGPLAFAAIIALYLFLPYVATNWFHVNSRIIPFFWLAALVRLPERLPRRARALVPVLGVGALTYTAGMGVDYVRLTREWTRFTAGMSAVPEGSRLLPLVFRCKQVSENTCNLLHGWGFYVTQKHTSAPLLFAHSRSFPVMYREAPPVQFNHLVLESFARSMGSPGWMCGILRSGGIAIDDCDAAWRDRWAELWTATEAQFDHVLLWAAPPEVLALVPSSFHVTFQRDELTILERRDAASPAR
jgi:hypothetical protein